MTIKKGAKTIQPPAKPHSGRLKILSKRMEKDSVLVLKSARRSLRNRDVYYAFRNSSDMLYLTGQNMEECILVQLCEGPAVVFMQMPDSLKERWEGKMKAPGEISHTLGIPMENIFDIRDFWTKIPEFIKNRHTLYMDWGDSEFDAKIIAIINDLNINTRAKDFGPVKIIQAGEIIHEMRLFKDKSEIECMTKAAQISAQAFQDTIKFTHDYFRSKGATKGAHKNALTEHDLRIQIEHAMMKAGSDELAYPTIVAAGNNATTLHYTACSDNVGKDDLVLIDAGCEWNFYASDITRTYPACGKFSPEQKAIYNITLEAQKKALKLCRPGKTLKDIHDISVSEICQGLWDLGLFKKLPEINTDAPNSKAGKNIRWAKPASVNEVIERQLYRHYYMHYTSHYLGLDVHDVGRYRIGPKERPLKPGMVFTVEPGIYLPAEYEFLPERFKSIGVRIEDDVYIDQNGPRILTEAAPKNAADLESVF